jgi:hypothetical protein
MKIQFIQKKFSPPSQRIIELSDQILTEYRKQGYRLSLRQLYYQMIARDLLPDSWADPKTKSTNNVQSYKKLGDIVGDARLAGLLSWDMIEDRGRDPVIPASWTSPAEIVGVAARQFRVDRWEGQENYVEVMVEKDALSGILEPVCRELHVRFTANKGYSSLTAMFDAGERIREALTGEGSANEAHIFYFGDHDPSGIDMTRDVETRLRQFARLGDSAEDYIHIHRLALNMDQVSRWNPPENPAKTTDSRFASYMDKYGTKSWELDAVEPSTLTRILRNSIEELIYVPTWKAVLAKETAMKNELMEYAQNYGKKKTRKGK